jgi:hypothetical protein
MSAMALMLVGRDSVTTATTSHLPAKHIIANRGGGEDQATVGCALVTAADWGFQNERIDKGQIEIESAFLEVVSASRSHWARLDKPVHSSFRATHVPVSAYCDEVCPWHSEQAREMISNLLADAVSSFVQTIQRQR